MFRSRSLVSIPLAIIAVVVAVVLCAAGARPAAAAGSPRVTSTTAPPTTAPSTEPPGPSIDSSTTLEADTTAVVGQPETLTAQVDPNIENTVARAGVSPRVISPTGTVDFQDGGATIPGCGAVAVAGDGSAECNTAYQTVGTHVVNATYSGDALYFGSESSSTDVDVSQANTHTTISESTGTTTAGDPVTFTINVQGSAPSDGDPSGTVTIYVDGTAVGTAPLDDTVDSQATFTTRSLGQGSHTITAGFSGTAGYAASVTAAGVVVVVSGLTVPDTGAVAAGSAALLPSMVVGLLLLGAGIATVRRGLTTTR